MSCEISIHIFVYVIIKMNQILSNSYISHLNYSYISYEFHFASETILRKVIIHSIRILIDLSLIWFTRCILHLHWFFPFHFTLHLPNFSHSFLIDLVCFNLFKGFTPSIRDLLLSFMPMWSLSITYRTSMMTMRVIWKVLNLTRRKEDEAKKSLRLWLQRRQQRSITLIFQLISL